jgi:TATA-box binding protein (TBP) (component of TFIID and TFIIIB)
MAYEFLPKHKININLDKACEELGSTCAVEVSSKVLAIFRVNDKTVSLFPSGKLLVRGEKDEDAARKIAEKVVKELRKSVEK